MKAHIETLADGEKRVMLDLSLLEALGVAKFFGALDTETANALGLTGQEYDTLADALEYGDAAPFPLDNHGRSPMYTLLQVLPRVIVSLKEAQ